jgi:hypothetical protein
MKMNLAPLPKPATSGGTDRPARTDDTKRFRQLKFNELVSVGDYVVGKDNEFEPWDGPRGFQAGSFVQPIYRPQGRRAVTSKKAKNSN